MTAMLMTRQLHPLAVAATPKTNTIGFTTLRAAFGSGRINHSVRLRYREKNWSRLLGLPSGAPSPRRPGSRYTREDVKTWRSKHRLPNVQHSLGVVAYTDEELLEWRGQFDRHANADTGLISRAGFEKLVSEKYGERRAEVKKELPQEKITHLWSRFDKGQKEAVDFGDFLKAGFLFDVQRAKAEILDLGPSKVFARYSDSEGYINEAMVVKLMEDFGFFTVTTTDVRRVLRDADQNRDGLLSEAEFQRWVTAATPQRHRSLDLPEGL